MSNAKSVVLIGLDAAADLRKFGYVICKVENGTEHIAVDICESDVLRTNDRIKRIFNDYISTSKRTILAIDAPLGWPHAFSKAVSRHTAGKKLTRMNKDEFFKRKTDQLIRQRFRRNQINPLEVSADKIARASAMALNVLDQFRSLCKGLGSDLELAWKPQILPRFSAIEVYPAATLAAWDLPSRKYKGFKHLKTAELIATAFENSAPKLRTLLPKENDTGGHIFDAGLCAIAALDFYRGEASEPSAEDKRQAIEEGWIWVKAAKQ